MAAMENVRLGDHLIFYDLQFTQHVAVVMNNSWGWNGQPQVVQPEIVANTVPRPYRVVGIAFPFVLLVPVDDESSLESMDLRYCKWTKASRHFVKQWQMRNPKPLKQTAQSNNGQPMHGAVFTSLGGS